MISICLYYNDETDLLEKFSVEGHAGYAESGKDIVCAGVSALAASTINALLNRFKVDVTECQGFLSCSIRKPDSASNLITSAFREGVTSISEQYKDFVKVHRFYLE